MKAEVQGCSVAKELGPIDSESASLTSLASFYCDKVLGHAGEHVAIGVDWELCWVNDEEDTNGE